MTRRVGERWQPDWHKVLSEDGSTARILDGQGQVMEVEYYEFTGEECSGDPLVNVRVESAGGELIARNGFTTVMGAACRQGAGWRAEWRPAWGCRVAG